MRSTLALLLAAATISATAVAPLPAADVADGHLSAFSAAEQEWGAGVEGIIEEAYRACFKTYIIEGQVVTVRMPFAQNNERAELANGDLIVRGGGKADPVLLWEKVDELLASADFKSYAAMLGDGREKVVALDLGARSWSVSRDLFSVARMKADAYPGLPHKPYVFSDGAGVKSSDVYNYLYCVGRLGMDCSGFVWHVLSTVAREGGLDLSRALARSLRAPSAKVASLYFGTWYFTPRNKETIIIKDSISNLRPLDLILFRGDDGNIVHSSVIQSIDRKNGVIRYLQSTDEAPLNERGVHESFIRFDPAKPDASLKDPSLVWTQRRLPPFEGERSSKFTDDGDRFRAFPEFGGGTVVRLRALAKPLERIAKRK
jgi:hypothetical protein